ncbi:cytochrome c551 [Bacillus sp. FJAT-49736]|uniref:cytochrome c551 n=1 Tax=Bacillus sp. FJAT-49736 TaxID=2833582 RepID=UPI001BCA65A6|nr:cytochrome c [Bacillus sp. FJAT-49736]MBS4174130.1 cytochrome c [Bacillus sp. FJAT-49736]
MKRKLAAAVMVVMLALAMVACGNKNDTSKSNNNNATSTASAGDAQKLFEAKCSACHGKDLGGLNGPKLQKIGSKYSKDQILDIIKNGKGNGAMPAGLYSGKDADAVATWLSNKK